MFGCTRISSCMVQVGTKCLNQLSNGPYIYGKLFTTSCCQCDCICQRQRSIECGAHTVCWVFFLEQRCRPSCSMSHHFVKLFTFLIALDVMINGPCEILYGSQPMSLTLQSVFKQYCSFRKSAACESPTANAEQRPACGFIKCRSRSLLLGTAILSHKCIN